MKITPQDIIDKEFRVRFRGFDMAAVDTFLEEVAENFYKLLEENTRLNEKVAALQGKIRSGGGETPPGQLEIPADLENFLEELKQDTAVINAELAALRQDRSAFASLEKSLKEAVGALQGGAALLSDRQQPELPDDLAAVLQDLARGTEAVNAGLVGLKEDRQAFDLLKKDLAQALALIREAGPSPAVQAERGDLAKTLEEFRQGTRSMQTELAAIKQEVASIQQFHEEISSDLQGLLKSHFADLEKKLSQAGPAAGPAPPKAQKPAAKKKAEPLKTAIIKEEPEDTRIPDDEDEEEPFEDDELEFLTEDDILDVDKLRGVFQSVLDDTISDGHTSREGEDEVSSDLLFLDDSLVEVEHEPEVTFSLDEKDTGSKPAKQGKP